MLPNEFQFQSANFRELIKFEVSKPLEIVIPERIHHSKVHFVSGNPRRKFDITCQPLPDRGQRQIIGFLGISHNCLGVIYHEVISNDSCHHTQCLHYWHRLSARVHVFVGLDRLMAIQRPPALVSALIFVDDSPNSKNGQENTKSVE